MSYLVAQRNREWMSGWTKDLSRAVRQLRRAPGFSLVVAATLALGIGANTAIFSLVYGILIAPLPFAQPEKAVVLSEYSPAVSSNLVSPVTYADWESRSPLYEELAAFRFWENRSVEFGPANALPVLQVTATPNYFRALGWQPLLGRTYQEEHAGDNEAVLSYDLWMRLFNGDRGALGRQIRISGAAFLVVGVMPPIHKDLSLGLADIWTPLHRYDLQQQRAVSYRARYLGVIGRLKPGGNLARARNDMASLQAQLAQEPTSVAKGFNVRVESLQDAAGRRIRPVLLALFAAVTFVFVIACINVANLMLTRTASRLREYAIRAALGARRAHLARQAMAESLLLCGLGGLAGLVIATAVVAGLKARLAVTIPAIAAVTISWPVMAFAGFLVALVTILFSLLPLASFGRAQVHDALKESGRSGAGMARDRLRSALVTSEVAFAVLLLCTAGLLFRSFTKLLLADPGFATGDRIVADIVLPTPAFNADSARLAYYRSLFHRLSEHPGVSAAGAALYFPCRPKLWPSTIWVEGSAVEEGREPIVYYNLFAGDYFRAMGIPLRRGRFPREEELWENRDVALINQSMEKQLFPGLDPIGKRFKSGKDGRWVTIIGVVGDVRQKSLDEAPRSEFYVPFASMPMSFMTVVVHSRTAASAAIDTLQTAANEGAADLKIQNVNPLAGLVEDTVSNRRLAFLVLVLFAALSLALAGIGVYGVTSYSVSQRMQEVGLRIALGASQVLGAMASQSLKTALGGVLAGLSLAALAGPAVRSLLYGVSPFDPAVYAAIPLLTLTVVTIASFIPVMRAVAVDPLVSLRGD